MSSRIHIGDYAACYGILVSWEWLGTPGALNYMSMPQSSLYDSEPAAGPLVRPLPWFPLTPIEEGTGDADTLKAALMVQTEKGWIHNSVCNLSSKWASESPRRTERIKLAILLVDDS
jgi:hypothetical protein